MMIFDQFFLLIIAFLANVFSAFCGGGAGVIQLPALLFLGLPFGLALATHKVATVALGFGAFARHARQNSLERFIALLVIGFGLPGVVLGSSVILFVPESYARFALGVLTVGIGFFSILQPSLGIEYQAKEKSLRRILIGGLGLFIIGSINGSLASGSGLLLTMWLVTCFGLDYKRAVAYTLVIGGIFWNSAGALTLGILGEIKWSWIPALVVGALIGGYTGSHLAIIKGSSWIKRGFEILTLIVGTKLLMG